MRTPVAFLLFFISFATIAQTIDRDVQIYIKNFPRLLKVAQTPDNNYLIYGWFDYYGTTQTGSLVKVDVNGNTVPGFKPFSPRYLTRRLEVLPTGKILVVTDSPSEGGRLLRLNADGSVDNTFTPDVDLRVVMFDLQSTGKIVVTTLNEGTGYYSLKRLNANGTIDTGFSTNASVGFAANMVVAPDDRIYLDAPTSGTSCTVVRVLANGAIDNTFSFSRNDYQLGLIRVTPNGKVLVELQSINQPQYNSRVEQLTETGATDPNFTPYVAPQDVRDIIVRSNGKLLLGGGWLTGFNSVVELNSDGSYSRAIASTNVNAVENLFEDAAGAVFVAGEFEQINSVNRNRLARLYPDFQVDANFVHKAFYTAETENNIEMQSDGKLLVWGKNPAFRGVGDNTSSIVRLKDDFKPDPSFVNALTRDGFATTIYDVAVQDDDKIIVGGRGIFPSGKHFGRLKANGEIDNTFSTGAGPVAASSLTDVAEIVWKNSKLYVRGTFDSWDGTPGSLLVILDRDGNRIGPANTILPSTTNFGRINNMLVQSDGKIILRGNFPFQTGTKEFIRLNADGSLDNTFTAASPTVGNAANLVLDPATDGFYLVGNFLDGISGRSLSKYNKDGVRDVSFNGEGFGTGATGYAAVLNDGKIAVGGVFFNQYKGENSPGLVIIDQSGTRVPYDVEFVRNPLCYGLTVLKDDLYAIGRFVNDDDGALSSVIKIETGPVHDIEDMITNFHAEAISASTISLKWSGVFKYATRIAVERSDVSDGNYNEVALLFKNDSTFADTHLDASTKYYYRIIGRDSEYSALHVPSVNTTTLASTALPPAPVALSAVNIDTASFTARWKYPAGADSVVVELSKDSFATILQSQTTDEPDAFFSGLAVGGVYKYRVKQYQNGLASLYSSAVAVKLIVPEKINSFTAAVSVVPYDYTVLLKWKGAYPNAESIELSMSEMDQLHYKTIAIIPLTDTTYTYKFLKEATKYFFKITIKRGSTSVSRTASFTMDVDRAKILDPTAITHDSFNANWEWAIGTDSMLLQVSRDTFKTSLPGLEKKIFKTTTTSFKVTGLQEGKAYQYRVKRFRNGYMSVSSAVKFAPLILGVEDGEETSVFPNPVVDILNFRSDEYFELLNTQGQTLYSGKSNGSIDMRHYPAGMYFIKTSSKFVKVIKL